jgi:hypothetical protein
MQEDRKERRRSRGDEERMKGKQAECTREGGEEEGEN